MNDDVVLCIIQLDNWLVGLFKNDFQKFRGCFPLIRFGVGAFKTVRIIYRVRVGMNCVLNMNFQMRIIIVGTSAVQYNGQTATEALYCNRNLGRVFFYCYIIIYTQG